MNRRSTIIRLLVLTVLAVGVPTSAFAASGAASATAALPVKTGPILHDVRPGYGVTNIGWLSDYFAPIRGSAVDTRVYYLDSQMPGPTLFILGGTHSNEIAGIMAAKRTPDLVPLCHPIALSGVVVDLAVDRSEVRITARVRTTDRTGVEMEALTAVAVAGLTLHDMIKAVDPAAVLDAVRVERKDGGKTGTWTRPEGR